jgi:hypothetical protein
MNGTRQCLLYGDNLVGGNLHNVEKNTKEFLVAGKEFRIQADTG